MATTKKTATKATASRSDLPPVRCRFFLADDLRQEVGGKVSAIGLYSDDVIVLQLPTEEPAPTVEKPIGFEGICVLISLSGLVGTRECNFELLGPTGTPILRAAPASVDFPTAANSVNLISKFRPFICTQFGKFKFAARIGEHRFEYEFEIRRGPA